MQKMNSASSFQVKKSIDKLSITDCALQTSMQLNFIRTSRISVNYCSLHFCMTIN